MKFPADLLKVGDNEITITGLSGSWALYDHVTLEAPQGTELAPVSDPPSTYRTLTGTTSKVSGLAP